MRSVSLNTDFNQVKRLYKKKSNYMENVSDEIFLNI